MRADQLHVFVARANPLRWQAPDRLFRTFAQHMLDSGVVLHVIECAYGDRPFEFAAMPGIRHVGVRAKTMIWNKECLLKIGIARAPDARYIAWIDGDILFRRPDWAVETVHALQLYDVVQPWSDAYDLGPNGEHLELHRGFARVLFEGGPVVPRGSGRDPGDGWWKHAQGPYHFPHPGYAWACTRQAYDWLGGLLDIGGMGSGDHHMALGLAGSAEWSLPGGVHPSYRRHVMRWQERALLHVNGNVGFVPGTIEHGFHGAKPKRGYNTRWNMFTTHRFDPDEDLKRNADGVIELSGNKPALRRDFDRYLRARQEDANTP